MLLRSACLWTPIYPNPTLALIAWKIKGWFFVVHTVCFWARTDSSSPRCFFPSLTPKGVTAFSPFPTDQFLLSWELHPHYQLTGLGEGKGNEGNRQGMVGQPGGTLNPARKHWYSFTNRTQHFYSLIDFLLVLRFATTREEHKNTVQHCYSVGKAGRESKSQHNCKELGGV